MKKECYATLRKTEDATTIEIAIIGLDFALSGKGNHCLVVEAIEPDDDNPDNDYSISSDTIDYEDETEFHKAFLDAMSHYVGKGYQVKSVDLSGMER